VLVSCGITPPRQPPCPYTAQRRARPAARGHILKRRLFQSHPVHRRRHRTQDGLDIAAGLQAEHGAAIIRAASSPHERSDMRDRSKRRSPGSCRRRLRPVGSPKRSLRIPKMFSWFRRAPAAPTDVQLRVAEALVGYPPYSPPKWNPDPEFLRANIDAYREYFFGCKDLRLHALGEFFAKFDVGLNLDDAGLMAVSTWLPLYADLLLDDLQRCCAVCISGLRKSLGRSIEWPQSHFRSRHILC
jgi:hypothetical protein